MNENMFKVAMTIAYVLIVFIGLIYIGTVSTRTAKLEQEMNHFINNQFEGSDS
jgi:hypothetical protein